MLPGDFLIAVALLVFATAKESGGSDVRDPDDARSTNHGVDELSTDRVVVIEWAPVEAAEAYSVE